MRNPSRPNLGLFTFSLALSTAGLLVALVYAADMRGVDHRLTFAFVIAYTLVDAMSVRLSRGDAVFVDGAIALSSVILLSPAQAVISCLLGVALGATFDTRNRKTLVVRLGEILRRPLLVAALALLARRLLDPQAIADGQTTALATALGLGLLHSIADFALLAFSVSLERHVGIWRSIPGLARSLAALYAAHASLGVVAALLFPAGHIWALVVMVVIVLLIQYSFNLLLRTKGAYGETIQALVRASELQSGAGEDGHSQRVADLCVNSGRQLGLASKTLERLNYAALLHEIGRIGLDEGASVSPETGDHSRRGADIVEGIPFLESAQAMIRHQAASPPSEDLILDEDDALCAQLIGVCCALDHWTPSRVGPPSASALVDGLKECAPDVDSRVRDAIMKAQVRTQRAQGKFV